MTRIVDISPKPPSDGKTYLGDGLYAAFDGWQYVLTAEDGIRVTNVVYLNPEVLAALNSFTKHKGLT